MHKLDTVVSQGSFAKNNPLPVIVPGGGLLRFGDFLFQISFSPDLNQFSA
jgi:hypothetical protein